MGTALVDRPHPTAPSQAAECDYRSRVSVAALSCLSRFGLTKTTVDDIARQAKLSRATLYRVFPGGREEIVASALAAEVERYFSELAEALSQEGELEGLLVTALVKAADSLASHETLGFLLANEPETVVPYLSFSGSDLVLERAGDFLAPFLAGHLSLREAKRVGQWMARLVLSYVACPRLGAPRLDGSLFAGPEEEPSYGLHPEPIGRELASRLVRSFVLPGIGVLKESSKEAIS